MKKDSRIYVAGHTGLVGSAVIRELHKRGYHNTPMPLRDYLDLRETTKVQKFFFRNRPEYVFNCAAHAGGISEAINHPVEMLNDNIKIQSNIIEHCHLYGAKLINLGSSCIYPVDGQQPYIEEQIGTGRTDENWSYAIAKIAGIEMCQAYHTQYGDDFISIIPCNLYGYNDNFSENGHVIPSLIRKFHEATDKVEIWGDGKAVREFLHADDFARACVDIMENCIWGDVLGVINVGSGECVDISVLVQIIRNIVNPCVGFFFNETKPNGVASKVINSRKARALGWEPKITLREGIRGVYEDWAHNQSGDSRTGTRSVLATADNIREYEGGKGLQPPLRGS